MLFVAALTLATSVAGIADGNCYVEGTSGDTEMTNGARATAMLQVKAYKQVAPDLALAHSDTAELQAVHLHESRECVSEALQEMYLVCIRRYAIFLATGPHVKNVGQPGLEEATPSQGDVIKVRDAGDNTCPAGFTYMEQQQCMDAAKLGKPAPIPSVTGFGRAGNWGTTYPKGCWISGSFVNFNTNPVGGPDDYRRLVCIRSDTIVTVPLRQYFAIHKNSNACPENSRYMTEEECIYWSNKGTIPNTKGFAWSSGCESGISNGMTPCPKGCYIDADDQRALAYFNNATSGGSSLVQRHAERDLLCISANPELSETAAGAAEKIPPVPKPQIPADADITSTAIHPPSPTRKCQLEVVTFANQCSTGYRRMTQTECENVKCADNDLAIDRFGSAGGWGTQYPRGCWKSGAGVNFNTDDLGGPSHYKGLVCAQDSPTTTKASTTTQAPKEPPTTDAPTDTPAATLAPAADTPAPTVAPAAGGGVGTTASLDAAGFKGTTMLCCSYQMEIFFNRVLDSTGYDVCSKPHVQGLMHWFTCVPDMDFQYMLDVIEKGNPCKYWSPRGLTCPALSEKCAGKWCR